MADSDTEFDYAVPVRRSIVATLPARLGMPLVMTPADLPSLPDKLGAAGEFAFALTFAPALVDAVADHGYFPMALDIGVPVFAPKVHKERCALALQARSTLMLRCNCGPCSPSPPPTRCACRNTSTFASAGARRRGSTPSP